MKNQNKRYSKAKKRLLRESGFVALLSNLSLRRPPKRLLTGQARFMNPVMIVAIGALAITGGVIINNGFAFNNNTSLWVGTTEKPAGTATWDTNSMELGVKFTSDKPGAITGISFYKDARNTGIHSGSLWTDKGVLLGTVTFTNETPSGWQTALFDKPITIQSKQVYVASYHTNTGVYSVTTNYFSGHSRDRSPLHALRSVPGNPNGVTAYRAGFPTDSFADSNYWVDVVFQAADASPTNQITQK